MEELPKYKAGTKESIVNEMLKYGGLAILDMLAGLVETLWSTERVPRHWRAGDILGTGALRPTACLCAHRVD